MNRNEYKAEATEKGKWLFANFADDWKENLIILAVGIALGRFGAPWLI